MSDAMAISIVHGLEDGQATVEMYDAAKTQSVKSEVFGKLRESDRVSIRARSKGACEKMIASAKDKGKDTFEMGGFYLGMNISDVDALVGYYFPEWSNAECFGDDEKTIRVLRVPQQKLSFCRADKDGKVFEFNFGKNFLKKFYKFDVQNYGEWASAYGKKSGFDLRFNRISKEFSISNAANNFFNGGGAISEYKSLYVQESYTYKHNAKEFRVTYYGEYEVMAGNSTVKALTWERARYGVGGEAGSLRVRIDKD